MIQDGARMRQKENEDTYREDTYHAEGKQNRRKKKIKVLMGCTNKSWLSA